MSKDVVVTVSGFQTMDADQDSVEVVANGRYTIKNNKGYLRFEEKSRESGVTKTVIVFDENSMEVTRNGMVQLRMTFLPGQKTMTNYKSPYGTMLMGVDTKDYSAEISENSVCLTVNYALEINHEFIADCKLIAKAT
ncbi:MAG: DUF1934 domain-containing protein [Lachnospiraceae bacterium]|nr:DUF1934 domain-containing protein [Lachnospiraceae bacterium]